MSNIIDTMSNIIDIFPAINYSLRSIGGSGMNLLSNISTTEKHLWAQLVVDLVVALYYFPKMFSLIRAGHTALVPVMAGVVVTSIILAIIVGIAVAILLRIWQEPERIDERDLQFSARGTLIANRVLVISILLIIGQLVFEGLFPGLRGRLFSLMTKPLTIAHFLLLSLLFSSVIKSIAQLFLYRRAS
jgi:hypothetical protein